jgi:cyclopropane fatty-acyl-phospholipid synthase-like methyltransferase
MYAPMKTDWDTYHRNCRQLTVGRIPQYFHWKAYRFLLNKIDYNKKISILELGSGTGLNSLRMCEYLDIGKVTLVDSNPSALRMSRKLLSKFQIEKKFVETDVSEYQADERYDIVHSHGLIEHFSFSERNSLIKKHIDFAVPGGHVIIFVPTPLGNYKKFRRTCEFLRIWPFPDEIPIHREELIQELTKYDISIIAHIIYTVFYPTLGILVKKGRVS